MRRADRLPRVAPCATSHRPGSLIVVDHAAAVARLLSLYASATPVELRDGLAWYARAGRTLSAAARDAGRDPLDAIAVAAALSPRSPWAANLASALALVADPAGPTRGPVLPRSAATARAYLRGRIDLATAVAGPKVTPFARNLAGDLDPVTVDVWATRAALGRSVDLARCGCDHAAIGDAYRDAARVAGIAPAQMQAVTWVVVRRGARS